MSAQHELTERDRNAARPPPTGAAPPSRRTAAPADGFPPPLQVLQRAAGNRAVSAYLQRLAPAQPRAAVTAPAPAATPALTGAVGTGGPAHALAPLGSVDSADFPAQLAQAAPSTAAALATEQAAVAAQLPSRPAPTGLPVGDAPPLPAPAEPAAPSPLPAPGPDADAEQTDELGRYGGSAVGEAAMGAQVTLPSTADLIHPAGTPPVLPTLDVPAAPAVAQPPASSRAAGAERSALNASMNTEVHALTSQALAPALAASTTHQSEVAAARSGAEESVAAAEADSTGRQRDAAALADAEVRDLHAGWLQDKATVLTSSQSHIQSEAGQTRSEANRTMDEARTKAEAETAKQQGDTAQPDPGPGLWDRVKAAGSRAVSAVGHVAAGAVSLVSGIFQAAKQRVASLVTRLGQAIRERVDAAVRALTEGVRRVSTAISGAIRRGREVVSGLAAALATTALGIWQAAGRLLGQLWSRLTAVVGRALAAMAAVARRIGDALGKVRQILKLLDNKLLSFMAETVGNPEEKVGRPIVALAAPGAARVPAKAEGVGLDMAQGGPAAAQASVPVQRDVPPGPAGETFWGGVKRHAKAAGNAFLEHWAMNLLKIVVGILAFPVTACRELPALWHELVGIFQPEPGGGDRLDHLLGVLRQVVNIAGVLVAGVGVWALLFGLAFPAAEPFLGGGYLAISMGVLAADAIVATAQLTKSYVSASRASSPEERELYLGTFSGSLIGAAITAVMVAIGAAATWLAKVFRGVRPQPAGDAGVVAKPKVGKGEPIGEPAATDVGAKGGPVPRPMEWPYSNPPDIRTVPPGTPLDLKSLNPRTKYLWVVDGEGNFKFAPERQNSSDFMKPLPPETDFSIKHGDLVPGEGGMSRGPARAGGELKNVTDIDGNPSDMWNLNNDSSYTFRRVDPNGQPLPWLPAESIEAVRQHLMSGGTPGEKLVTTDILAAERVKRGVK